MNKEWYTAMELAGLCLPDMPTTDRAIQKQATKKEWKARRNVAGDPLARRRKGRGGGWEYHFTLLPSTAQAALLKNLAPETERPTAPEGARQDPNWAHYEKLPERHKATAEGRLRVLETVKALQRGGQTKDRAVYMAGQKFKTSPSTIYNWFQLVAGVDRENWLPHLTPRYSGHNSQEVDCDPRAWDFLKTDYLRLEKPSFTSCYRRLQATANAEGWEIPSDRTLTRRIERDIPKAVRVLMRDGADALKFMYPAQERDRTQLHALEAVNLDGHIWDVFVRWPDGTIGRPVMVAIQDLYSNKMLGWRIDRTENADCVRLALADVFRRYGLPDRAYMDNGRGFASKWITGGAPNRFRFKVKPEEPAGVLTALGIEARWTLPYSGQSKPIERAFRDFCDAIAKHPAFAGAYTGNSPMAKPENYGSAAVDLKTFTDIVGQSIRLHNAQPGRNTRVCQRRLSFERAFEESYADSLIRKASAEQLRMCLLAAESVRADRRSGAINLLGNRYWSESLHDVAGHPLTVRFDPDNLHEGVHVYRMDGAYIAFAECLEAAGFEDTQAAREHGRARRQFIKATREAAKLERRLSIDELARLLPRVDEDEPPPETKAVRPMFANGTHGNLAAKPAPETEAEEDADAVFFKALGNGLRIVQAEKE